MRPEALCGLLAEEERLRAFAAVVLGAATPIAVATATGMSPPAAARALRRLERGGLVKTVEGRLVAQDSAFKDAFRQYVPKPVPEEPHDPDRRKDAILRAFLRDGRLIRLPAAHGKRLVVLEHLAAAFEPGVRYPEREVNAMLRAWYDDYAALRRYLVDEELLSREAGLYWRTGGYVDIAGSGRQSAGSGG